MPKVDSAITGDLAHKTWLVTSPSITLSHTTSPYIPQSSQLSMIPNKGNSLRQPQPKQENPDELARKKKNKQQKST
jgi:hypothetical protein